MNLNFDNISNAITQILNHFKVVYYLINKNEISNIEKHF